MRNTLPGAAEIQPPDESAVWKLPFRFFWPLLAGVLAGVALRLLFGIKHGSPYAPMMASFIYLSPILVGIVTVYVAERQRRRRWGYYFAAPFLANVLYVVGTLVINIEGWICAILIVPLFAILGGVGGLIMGAICRLTNWPRQALYSFATLPFVLGLIESGMPLPERTHVVENAILIDAPPEFVWREIENVRDIRPEEVDRAWMYRIGVPVPKSGITQKTHEGLVRRITMGKNIYFDQVVTDWQPNRYVHWTYHFYPDSFPPYALDEHVVLGGQYFDVNDTSYSLAPHGQGTQLRVHMSYRVSTQFNWYAEPLARFLVGNFEDVVLQFYRQRSEASLLNQPGATAPDNRSSMH